VFKPDHTLRYVHVKVENNPALDNHTFGSEAEAELKVWGYGQNGRMDMTAQTNDEGQQQLSMMQLSDQDKTCMAAQGYYECEPLFSPDMESLDAVGDSEPNHQSDFFDEFLNDGPFAIPHLLHTKPDIIGEPIEQRAEDYLGKRVQYLLYHLPPEYAPTNIELERYVEVVLDANTNTLVQYALLNSQKVVVTRVTFLENKIVDDIDSTVFFTEEYWKNDLQLIKGKHPAAPIKPN
jgi:hypothetical protein